MSSSVSVQREHPCAIVCREYAVIGTLEVLLYSLCHIWREILHVLEQFGNPRVSLGRSNSRNFELFLKGLRMFRNLRNIRTHSSWLVEPSRWETPEVVEPIAWISCSFLYRVRPFSALHEQSHAVTWLEYVVIGTLEMLLLCLCHLRRRHYAHGRVISKVDEYH